MTIFFAGCVLKEALNTPPTCYHHIFAYLQQLFKVFVAVELQLTL